MAFAVQYRYEFQEAYAESLGLQTARYRVSFLRDGYSGAIIEVLPSDEPLVIETADSSDSLYGPILSQKYTFNLACETFWQAQDFYVISDREMQVVIQVDYSNTGNAWELLRMGWVLPDDLTEQYGPKPYYVTVSAACGLSTLKERDLLDASGKRLQGLVSLSTVIRTALQHTDITCQLVSGINLFEQSDVTPAETSGGFASKAKDPLYQAVLHAEVLVSDDFGVISCWDALEMCLNTMECVLTQIEGRWWVVRVSEMAGGWDVWNSASTKTLHIRGYYSEDPATGPNAGNDLSVNLNVTANDTDRHLLTVDNDPNTILLGIEEGIRIEQSYGRNLGNIPNGDFAQVDGTGLPTGWFVNNLLVNERFRKGTGTEADLYRMALLYGGDQKFDNNTPFIAVKATYDLSSREYTQFVKRTFKCEAELFNAGSAKVAFLAVRDDGPYFFTGGDWIRLDKLKKAQAVAVTVSHINIVNGRQVAKPGVFEVSVDLGTIDRVREFVYYLCQAEAINHYDSSGHITGPEQGQTNGIIPRVEYRNLQLITEQEGLNIEGTQRTIVRPGKTVKNTTLNIKLGDVPDLADPVSRVGTLGKRRNLPGFVPTASWYRPDWGILSNGTVSNGGKGILLIDWLARNRAKQLMFTKPTFEGDLVGRLAFGPLSVLSITDAPDLGAAPLMRWKWEVRGLMHTVSAQKLMADVIANTALPAVKQEWQTPDGPVLMNIGEDGLPVLPADKGFISDEERIKKLLGNAGALKASLTVLPTQNGFVPVSGQSGLSLKMYRNNVLVGTVPAVLRKPVRIRFPL